MPLSLLRLAIMVDSHRGLVRDLVVAAVAMVIAPLLLGLTLVAVVTGASAPPLVDTAEPMDTWVLVQGFGCTG
ncbi:MAG: hypothetical protein ACYDGR_11915, partial [Candidatus Dormibacteria bacterium]